MRHKTFAISTQTINCVILDVMNSDTHIASAVGKNFNPNPIFVFCYALLT